MEFKGSGFKYFFNNESKTIDEIRELVDNNTTVSIKGLDVHYFSPKKELNKTEKLLKEVEQHQKQNGGRIDSEFPYNDIYGHVRVANIPLNLSNLVEISLEKENTFKDYVSDIAKLNKKFPCGLGTSETDLKNKYLTSSKEAKKETKGKLFYELDFNFIKQMAERMQSNKDNSKYELWNWKKPMTPKGLTDLKQATLRHLLEVLEDKYEDDGRIYGHLEAISNNVMMINYQLKNNK